MTFEERVMACLKFRTRKYVEHVRAKAFTDEYRELEWGMIADLCRCLDIPARALGLIVRKWIRNPSMDAVEQEIKEFFGGV